MIRAAIITVDTDKYKKKEEDKTLVELKRMLLQVSVQTVFATVLPAEEKVVGTILQKLTENPAVDMVLTVGACGTRRTDCVPEATRGVVKQLLPGIPEALRAYNLRYSKSAILDRSVAGITDDTLIVNLPDCGKCVQDSLEYVLPELLQAVEEME